MTEDAKLEFSKTLITLNTAIATILFYLRIQNSQDFKIFYASNSRLFTYTFNAILLSLLLGLVSIYLNRFKKSEATVHIMDAISGILLFVAAVLVVIILSTTT